MHQMSTSWFANIGSIRPFYILTANAVVARSLVVAIGAAALLSGIGCQSTSPALPPPHPRSVPRPRSPRLAVPFWQPTRPVVVHDFAFDVAQLHTDQGIVASREGPAKRVLGNLRPEEKPADKAAHLASLLSETIAKELTDLKIPATRAPRGAPLPADGFVVVGEFLEVDEGNRLKRAVVGFGAGSTEVLVQVAVYDLAQSREHPILVYGTGADSKPTPGGVVSLNPYAMAAR